VLDLKSPARDGRVGYRRCRSGSQHRHRQNRSRQERVIAVVFMMVDSSSQGIVCEIH